LCFIEPLTGGTAKHRPPLFYLCSVNDSVSITTGSFPNRLPTKQGIKDAPLFPKIRPAVLAGIILTQCRTNEYKKALYVLISHFSYKTLLLCSWTYETVNISAFVNKHTNNAYHQGKRYSATI